MGSGERPRPSQRERDQGSRESPPTELVACVENIAESLRALVFELRRIGTLVAGVRETPVVGKLQRARGPLPPQPNEVQPSELDRARARQALRRSGRVKP